MPRFQELGKAGVLCSKTMLGGGEHIVGYQGKLEVGQQPVFLDQLMAGSIVLGVPPIAFFVYRNNMCSLPIIGEFPSLMDLENRSARDSSMKGAPSLRSRPEMESGPQEI